MPNNSLGEVNEILQYQLRKLKICKPNEIAQETQRTQAMVATTKAIVENAGMALKISQALNADTVKKEEVIPLETSEKIPVSWSGNTNE